MKYIKVKWIHNSKEDPIDLYSELDDHRFEVRKVEIFPDGSYGYADGKNNTKNTVLGDQEVPPFEEVNSRPEFKLKEINQEEFEDMWKTATKL